MIRNMICKAPQSIVKAIGLDAYRKYCGVFTSPRTYISPIYALAYEVPWAADNDCFTEYKPDRIKRWLEKWANTPGCQFFNAPDVLLDAEKTTDRFHEWQPIISGHGFPVAYTVQNGCHVDMMPWDTIDALFIGANDQWRTKANLVPIISEANRRGLWVHMGRIHSIPKVHFAKEIECTSFDSTAFARHGKYSIQKIRSRIIAQEYTQGTLF